MSYGNCWQLLNFSSVRENEMLRLLIIRYKKKNNDRLPSQQAKEKMRMFIIKAQGNIRWAFMQTDFIFGGGDPKELVSFDHQNNNGKNVGKKDNDLNQFQSYKMLMGSDSIGRWVENVSNGNGHERVRRDEILYFSNYLRTMMPSSSMDSFASSMDNLSRMDVDRFLLPDYARNTLLYGAIHENFEGYKNSKMEWNVGNKIPPHYIKKKKDYYMGNDTTKSKFDSKLPLCNFVLWEREAKNRIYHPPSERRSIAHGRPDLFRWVWVSFERIIKGDDLNDEEKKIMLMENQFFERMVLMGMDSDFVKKIILTRFTKQKVSTRLKSWITRELNKMNKS